MGTGISGPGNHSASQACSAHGKLLGSLPGAEGHLVKSEQPHPMPEICLLPQGLHQPHMLAFSFPSTLGKGLLPCTHPPPTPDCPLQALPPACMGSELPTVFPGACYSLTAPAHPADRDTIQRARLHLCKERNPILSPPPTPHPHPWASWEFSCGEFSVHGTLSSSVFIFPQMPGTSACTLSLPIASKHLEGVSVIHL